MSPDHGRTSRNKGGWTMDGKAHEKRILDTQKKNDKEEKQREKIVSVGFRDSNRKNASRMEKKGKRRTTEE